MEDIINELIESAAGYDGGVFAERCNVHLAEKSELKAAAGSWTHVLNILQIFHVSHFSLDQFEYDTVKV